MKRKVVRHGSNTLTVSLPAKWCRLCGVEPGAELDVLEKGRSLVIGGHRDSRERTVTADVSNLDRTSILLLIQGFYRYGYDVIEVTSNVKTVPHHRTRAAVNLPGLVYDVANRLIGAEIISASSGRFVIKRIAEESMDDFPTVLRRIFLLVSEMLDSFISGAQKNDTDVLASIEFKHSNIKKFINYCLRLLNKYGDIDPRKTCFNFHIISLLSKAEDIVKNSSRLLLKHKIRMKPAAYDLLKDIQQSVQLYYELFYDYKIDKVGKINKHRDAFRDKLFSSKLSDKESVIVGGLSQIVELVLDMTETRMALED